jgi:hypothetical protein
MQSVFTLLRHLGLPVTAAYAIQFCVSACTVVAVARLWRSSASDDQKYAALVLGMMIAAPYVFDYDLVAFAFVPIWLMRENPTLLVRLSVLPVILLPLIAGSLARTTGVALGILYFVPAFLIALGYDGRAASPR